MADFIDAGGSPVSVLASYEALSPAKQMQARGKSMPTSAPKVRRRLAGCLSCLEDEEPRSRNTELRAAWLEGCRGRSSAVQNKLCVYHITRRQLCLQKRERQHHSLLSLLQPYRLTEDEKAELRRQNVEMSHRERLVVVRARRLPKSA